ncbi:MAG: hypothetical protein HQ513_04570 [Rhodospirillales bacterium]|nr:hypothetical protein [Rhodospirillales bacterium]
MLKHTAETTLLLAAHGSSRPGEDNPVTLLTRALKAQGIFADVHCGFLKQEPLLDEVLSDIKTAELIVVPMLSGHGYITDTLIPGALEALGKDVSVRLCEPLGNHPAIAGVMAQRALSVIATRNLERDSTSILIAAHGNASNPENSRQAKALAERIESLTGGVRAAAAFIEEDPLISKWQSMTAADNLIVLPFLIGGGLHGAEDVPVMLGLDAVDPSFDKLSDDIPFIGPLNVHNRQIWYCRALGFEPAMSDLILELASKK